MVPIRVACNPAAEDTSRWEKKCEAAKEVILVESAAFFSIILGSFEALKCKSARRGGGR
jgi:hypothetical protein